MNKILLGSDAVEFLNLLNLEHINYNNKLIDNSVLGGIINNSIKGYDVYTAFSCCGNETFVEDFDDIVEAAKYANGIEAKTINGDVI